MFSIKTLFLMYSDRETRKLQNECYVVICWVLFCCLEAQIFGMEENFTSELVFMSIYSPTRLESWEDQSTCERKYRILLNFQQKSSQLSSIYFRPSNLRYRIDNKKNSILRFTCEGERIFAIKLVFLFCCW